MTLAYCCCSLTNIDLFKKEVVYNFSYLTLRSYVLQNILHVYIVFKVLFLYFYYGLYITHLLLKFIPCGNGRFGDTAITASLKPMSAYPCVFENISKAVQSPTKERLFYTPEIYLQNKANYQSQVSSSFLLLDP